MVHYRTSCAILNVLYTPTKTFGRIRCEQASHRRLESHVAHAYWPYVPHVLSAACEVIDYAFSPSSSVSVPVRDRLIEEKPRA